VLVKNVLSVNGMCGLMCCVRIFDGMESASNSKVIGRVFVLVCVELCNLGLFEGM